MLIETPEKCGPWYLAGNTQDLRAEQKFTSAAACFRWTRGWEGSQKGHFRDGSCGVRSLFLWRLRLFLSIALCCAAGPSRRGENWWLPQIQRWMVHIRCLYHHSNPCTVWECSLERKKHWIFNMWITYKWLTLLKTKDNPRLVGWGKASQFFGELTRKASCSLPAAASAVCREEPSWGRPLGWLGVVG
jgi:hypothetical protein